MQIKGPFVNIWGEVMIADSTEIGGYVEIGNGVEIGERCKIQAKVFIPPGVIIGNDVFIGPGVVFTNDKHPTASGEWQMSQTTIEDNVNIGANSTILPVNIGRGATIGAGSVVTKDVPANETWAGNPARKLNQLNREDI